MRLTPRHFSPTFDALRANREYRAAVGAFPAPRAPGLRQGGTAQANQIRGRLGEYGLIVPQGIAYIASVYRTEVAPLV